MSQFPHLEIVMVTTIILGCYEDEVIKFMKSSEHSAQ